MEYGLPGGPRTPVEATEEYRKHYFTKPGWWEKFRQWRKQHLREDWVRQVAIHLVLCCCIALLTALLLRSGVCR